MAIKHTPPHPDNLAFVEELVRTSLMLAGLLEDMLDALPDDAFPGENPGEVLLEMLAGTMRPACEKAGPTTVRAATRLLDRASERVIHDLKLGLHLKTIGEA